MTKALTFELYIENFIEKKKCNYSSGHEKWKKNAGQVNVCFLLSKSDVSKNNNVTLIISYKYGYV